jgi:4-amino-4-deoxy-L-arabinose transferase-like glycosyltransferase
MSEEPLRARTRQLVLAAIVLFAFVVRVWGIGKVPFWIDEYTTYFFATEPLSRIFSADYLAETNPPLYYLLQRAWLVFGDSEFAMRLLPVCISTLCVPMLYLLGKESLGPKQGLVAAGLLATAPLHIEHSHNVRTYSLLTFGILGCTLFLVRLFKAYGVDKAERPAQRLGTLWLCYGLTHLAVLYMHNTAWLYPALTNVLVFGLVAFRCLPIRFLKHWVGVNALLLLAGMPWLLAMVKQSGTVMRTFWVPPTTPSYAYAQVMGLFPHSRIAKLLVFGLAPWGLFSLRRRPWLVALLLVFMLGQPLLMIGASLHQPMLLTRTMLWPTALVWLPVASAACGLTFLHGYAGIALGAVLGLFQLTEIRGWWSDAARARTPIQGLIEPLAGFDRDRDVLIVAPSVFAWDVWYEGRRFNLPRRGLGLTFDDKPTQLHAWLGVDEVPRSELVARLGATTGKVWLLLETRSFMARVPPDAFSSVVAELGRWGAVQQTWTSERFVLDVFARSSIPK